MGPARLPLMDIRHRAPLRWRIVGHVRPEVGPGRIAMDRSVKGGRDSLGGWCGVSGGFVVSVAEVAHEGISGDDHLRGAACLCPAYRSESMLEAPPRSDRSPLSGRAGRDRGRPGRDP
jgi:hypothetical protein